MTESALSRAAAVSVSARRRHGEERRDSAREHRHHPESSVVRPSHVTRDSCRPPESPECPECGFGPPAAGGPGAAPGSLAVRVQAWDGLQVRVPAAAPPLGA